MVKHPQEKVMFKTIFKMKRINKKKNFKTLFNHKIKERTFYLIQEKK